MKVCIVGAGAIGGFLGTRLAARTGAAVSALARGATLAALQQHGWRMQERGSLLRGPVRAAAADARQLGVQDIVVVAVKGPALREVAALIGPLLGDETIVLPAMNGVPWWFGYGVEALGGGALQSVDPGGAIAAAIPQRRVIGCVVHASSEMAGPGIVAHRVGQGLIVGEPDGTESKRLRAVALLLSEAGFDVTTSTGIRRDIWYKLWGNLTMNPISAITGATIDRVLDDPQLLEFCTAAMGEAAAIGARIGCEVGESPEDRHRVTRKLGAFKTSMLQDVEAGRPIELDAIVTSVHEIGRRVGVPTPNIDILLGLARLFGRVRGLYPAAAA